MSGKGSGRRNEDSQNVRDNWGAIRWDREAETKKNQELRKEMDAMIKCTFPFCQCEELCEEAK